MHKIKTTFQPETTISVDDRELEDLERQGLVYHEAPESPSTKGTEK